MDYLKAFLVGGTICMLGQLLIDKTRLTPARILVCYVVLGVILGGAGVYDKLVDFAGAGATVPLTGFGNTLAKGVREAVKEQGILGALTGGLKASAAGIAAAVFFGFLAALLGFFAQKICNTADVFHQTGRVFECIGIDFLQDVAFCPLL